MRLTPGKLLEAASVAILLSMVAFSQDAGTAAKKEEALQSGTVASVQEHPEGRVFDIVWPLTPIYDDYPYYDITIQTPERTYVVRYESMGGYYPSGWQTGKKIKFRQEKGQLLLLRYDGEFVTVRIL